MSLVEGKRMRKASSNEEASSSAKSEVKEMPKTDTLTEVKKEEEAVDIKKVDDLIDSYEQTVKEIEFLYNNPPMNPEAAVSKLEAFESAIKNAEAKINAAKMTDEQKARFEKAKAKYKKLG